MSFDNTYERMTDVSNKTCRFRPRTWFKHRLMA